MCDAGDCFVIEDSNLQRQVLCVLNTVLYDHLQYKGNELDYYNPLNSYIHQVFNNFLFMIYIYIYIKTLFLIGPHLLGFRCSYATLAFPSASLFSTWHWRRNLACNWSPSTSQITFCCAGAKKLKGTVLNKVILHILSLRIHNITVNYMNDIDIWYNT